jgi:hypothetical protein
MEDYGSNIDRSKMSFDNPGANSVELSREGRKEDGSVSRDDMV